MTQSVYKKIKIHIHIHYYKNENNYNAIAILYKSDIFYQDY